MSDGAGSATVKELLELIARALVDRPDEVVVTQITSGEGVVYEMKVAREDLGKVIGKQGRAARAVRTLVQAAGSKLQTRVALEIVE